MDIVGPLPRTKQGNRFIIVLNDYFTWWPEAFSVVDHDAGTVSKKLMEGWFSRLGVMQYLHTDQGREFESKVFQALCSLLGIKKPERCHIILKVMDWSEGTTALSRICCRKW